METLETTPITEQTEQYDFESQLKADRKATKIITIILSVGLLGLILAALTGQREFVLITCFTNIPAFFYFARYNCKQPPYKFQFIYYVLAFFGLFFVVAPIFRYSDYSIEKILEGITMFVPLTIYFAFFKPSRSVNGSKALKFLGYYLLVDCALVGYQPTNNEFLTLQEWLIMGIAFYLIAVLLVYLANRSYIKLLFDTK